MVDKAESEETIASELAIIVSCTIILGMILLDEEPSISEENISASALKDISNMRLTSADPKMNVEKRYEVKNGWIHTRYIIHSIICNQIGAEIDLWEC